MSKYVTLLVESKLYSVCSRSLSLKCVGEGEVEYWLSISPIALDMSLSLESFDYLPSKIDLKGLP